MIPLRYFLCCLLLCTPLVYAANNTSPSAESLKGKTVFLRGMELGNMLGFDARGHAAAPFAHGPFADSALKIEKVHESGESLEIKGVRMVMVLQTSSPSPSLSDIQFIPVKEPVEITIAAGRSHPEALDAAIEKVFAFSLQDMLAGKSPDAEKADLYTLGSTAQPNKNPGSEVGVRTVGKGVSPPKLIHAVDPDYPKKLGKKQHIQGTCLLSTIVDANGIPIHTRLIQSVHPVLDLNAIVAISQYRFEPATYQGKPVPVRIHIEVHYRIY